MIERDVEQHLLWRVAMMGGMTKKVKAIGQRGFPDRCVFLPNGAMWLIELKTIRGHMNEHQKQFQRDMAAMKQNYAVLWSIKMVDAWAAQFKAFVL